MLPKLAKFLQLVQILLTKIHHCQILIKKNFYVTSKFVINKYYFAYMKTILQDFIFNLIFY